MIRVVQYGLGPIGIETARAVAERPDLVLAGAIDIDPDKAGRDLGDLLDTGRSLGVAVGADAAEVLSAARPDVVLHTTTSFLDRNHDELERCAAAGAHVISSCEELLFPYDRHPELSERLDRTAKRHGVVILGTGVNPGFVMDTLALASTAVCLEVRHVRADRIVDAARRRLPLQRKVGAGLTREEFEQRKRAGTLGHIGLLESARLVADGLDWKLDRFDETLGPMIAPRVVKTPYLEVPAGRVAGIHHTVRGFAGDQERLVLELKMYVGAEEPHDAVRVQGNLDLDLVIRGGVFGDTATVATLINAIPLARAAAPGLHTMKTLGLPRAFATNAPA